MSTPDERLAQMKVTLPPVPKPLAKYRPALRVGNELYLAGHLPMLPDGTFTKGRVGGDLSVQQGYDAAKQVGLAILTTVINELGSLSKVKRIIKTIGLVNCGADFVDHPKVINGFSELMAEIFGDDAGVGTRSAFGAVSLPGNAAVEIECVFEV
ncbi:MAG: RidA family protein [Gemmataceae bacterium]|nr:RidA family protein [Gemmataceae bacterium]